MTHSMQRRAGPPDALAGQSRVTVCTGWPGTDSLQARGPAWPLIVRDFESGPGVIINSFRVVKLAAIRVGRSPEFRVAGSVVIMVQVGAVAVSMPVSMVHTAEFQVEAARTVTVTQALLQQFASGHHGQGPGTGRPVTVTPVREESQLRFNRSVKPSFKIHRSNLMIGQLNGENFA